MELKKENIALYLETLSRFEKVLFLLDHTNNKIKYDDEEETISFDLEVCQALLIQLINSPLMAASDIENHISDQEGRTKNFAFLIERLKILLGDMKRDVNEYLSKSLSF